ncbi:hypothetical protein CRG98_039278 [Punica granatum]|uniref:Uncharacterized protein n=1 Tax=Punica granatum TaxID=22663 RepID=A0A2I0I951_PUNGR|nr:hypothetical protein CRG98_039278 [Punica granatum]
MHRQSIPITSIASSSSHKLSIRSLKNPNFSFKAPVLFKSFIYYTTIFESSRHTYQSHFATSPIIATGEEGGGGGGCPDAGHHLPDLVANDLIWAVVAGVGATISRISPTLSRNDPQERRGAPIRESHCALEAASVALLIWISVADTSPLNLFPLLLVSGLLFLLSPYLPLWLNSGLWGLNCGLYGPNSDL